MHDFSSWRCVGAVAGALGGLGLSVPQLAEAPARLTGIDPTTALAALLHIVLATTSLWLLVGTLLVLAGALVPAAGRWAPRGLAALLATGTVSACGLGLGAAHGSPTDLDGLHLPDRVATSATAPMPVEAASTVVVQPGDCLWALARARLGTEATDAQVARATADWHRANLATIGADPDLLQPGQILTVPVPLEPEHAP